jgi:cell filamentation protein
VSDEEAPLSAQKAREEREAALVSFRILELRDNPIDGQFDADHLRAIHAYIFQDLPHHRPGVTRDDTAQTWIKHRALEGQSTVYQVPYVSQAVDAKLTDILETFNGPETIKGLTPEGAAERIAQLYGALDHAHGFYEGNSRTLREFTRELAAEAGFTLDWTKSGVGTRERNALYLARDVAVLEHAYPDQTPERLMQTNDIVEYEALNRMPALKRMVGDKSLSALIREGLSSGVQKRRAEEYDDGPERPLKPHDVLSRFADPSVQARYRKQEQDRAQTRKGNTSTPETPESNAARDNVPGEKQPEHKSAREKTTKDFIATRDADDSNPKRDRDNGNARPGRGGRGGRKGK